MTDQSQQEKQEKKKGMSRFVKTLVICVLFVTLGGFLFVSQNLQRAFQQNFAPELTKPSAPASVASATDPALDGKIQALDLRLSALNERLALVEQTLSALTTEGAAPTASSADLMQIKSVIAGLTSALVAIQDRQKKHETVNLAGQRQLTASLAASLSAVAASGKGFKHELDFLRQTASTDPLMTAPLASLKTLADIGAPRFDSLQLAYAALVPALEDTLRKAGAMTWSDRILVELQSLVRIRALHPSAGDAAALTTISDDLAHQQLGAALEKVAVLPPATQDILKDWKQGASRRLQLDAALEQIDQILTSETKGDTAPDGEAAH